MSSPRLYSFLEASLILSLAFFSSAPAPHTPETIQGVPEASREPDADASPHLGELLSVEGIVSEPILPLTLTEEPRYGFAIQMPTQAADGVPRRSRGLLVWLAEDAQAPDLKAGQRVSVRGRVEEVFGNTGLIDAKIQKVHRRADASGQVEPIVLNPPADVGDARSYWESLEGMQVVADTGSTLTGGRKLYAGGPDGAVALLPGGHPLLDQRTNPFSRRVFRDAHPLDDQPKRRFDNGNGFLLFLWSPEFTDPDGVPTQPRTFDALTQPVQGTLVTWYGRPVLITGSSVPLSAGPDPSEIRPPSPDMTETSLLSIVSYNLENLYDHRDDPFDRADFEDEWNDDGTPVLRNYVPATKSEYQAKIEGLAHNIVHALESPDLLFLQEVEDQDIGFVRNGQLDVEAFDNRDGELDVLQELILAIQKEGGPSYAMRFNRRAADYRGIITAFLYRTDRLEPERPPERHPVLGDELEVPYSGRLMSADPHPKLPRVIEALHPDRGDVFSRPPVVDFLRSTVVTGAPPLLLLNNHFKSRPNAAVARRTEQARVNALLAFATLQQAPDAWVLIGGDLNVYPRPHDPFPNDPSDQLGPLYEAGLLNPYDRQLEEYPEGAYSYIYAGVAQTLDQFFLSPALADRLQHVEYLHLNSDFTPGPRNPHRAWSDHDPLRLWIRLAP